MGLVLSASLIGFSSSFVMLDGKPVRAIDLSPPDVLAQSTPSRSGDLTAPLGKPILPDASTNPDTGNLFQTSQQRQAFRYFVDAVRAAGLEQMLAKEGPFTIFAPTDSAFEALPAGTLKALMRPENRALLNQILKYHMIKGRVSFDAFRNGPLPSLTGSNLFFLTSNGRVIVNNGRIVQPNLIASNGFIHGINQVLIPNTLRQQVKALTKPDS
jgi:uncharacterized surface protein with fasciclin (FAS1) repeats